MTASVWPPVTASAIRSDWSAAGVPARPAADAVGDLVGEDRAEHGDAGGDADLAERGVDARGHARSGRRSTTPTAVEASGVLIMPTPMPATIRPGIRWVHEESTSMPWMSSSPTPSTTKPGAISHLAGHGLGESAGDRRRDERGTGEEEEPDAGLDRGVAEHVLDVDHQVGEQREDRGRDPERRDQPAGERRLAEQRRGRTSGRPGRSWLTTNTTSSTAAPTRQTTTRPSSHSVWPARIRP